MTINDLLLGLRREYERASIFGAIKFTHTAIISFISILAVISTNERILYYLAALGLVLSASWLFFHQKYRNAQGASHSARRATMLLSGLGENLDPSILEQIRTEFEGRTGYKDPQTVEEYYHSVEALLHKSVEGFTT